MFFIAQLLFTFFYPNQRINKWNNYLIKNKYNFVYETYRCTKKLTNCK